MTTGRGILETNVVIDLAGIDPDTLPAEPVITAITLAELSVGPLAAKTPEEQARRQQVLQATESAFDPLPFDAAASRAFGVVAASLRASGRKPAARAYDALIAATALAHDVPLYTTNTADYEGIHGLDLRTVQSAGSNE